MREVEIQPLKPTKNPSGSGWARGTAADSVPSGWAAVKCPESGRWAWPRVQLTGLTASLPGSKPLARGKTYVGCVFFGYLFLWVAKEPLKEPHFWRLPVFVAGNRITERNSTILGGEPPE